MLLTKSQLEKEQKDELERLLQFAGSVSHLAKMLNTRSQNVQGWRDRGRISKKGAKWVELHTVLSQEFTALGLRPDL